MHQICMSKHREKMHVIKYLFELNTFAVLYCTWPALCLNVYENVKIKLHKKLRITSVTSLYRFSFLWVFQSSERWFFAANGIMLFTVWNIRGFVHKSCFCLKTRKPDTISQWDGLEGRQHRIACLMQKSKPLGSPPFSSPVWEPHLFEK